MDTPSITSAADGSDEAESDVEVPPFSEFDLPLQFHKDSIKTWVIVGKIEEELWGQLKHVMDPVRHTRFEGLNRQILLKTLKSRDNFNYIREMAVLRVEADTLKQLKLSSLSSSCVFQDFGLKDPIIRTAFSWEESDFQKRLEKGLTWIAVLELSNSENCLEAQKFQSDLRQIVRRVTAVFDHLLPLPENIGIEALTNSLDQEKHFLDIEETLMEQLEANTRTYDLERKREAASLRASLGGRRGNFLMHTTLDDELTTTIETRHQLHHLKDRIEQYECLAERTAVDLQREIDFYNQEVENMIRAHKCSMTVLTNDIKLYSRMLPDYNEKYDKKTEQLNDEATYIQIAMDKLRAQRKFHEREIARFHEEVAELIAEQKRQEEEEEAKRLLAEEERLLKLKQKQLAKKAKGKERKSQI